MSGNLVRIRPSRWQFDAIGSRPRLVEEFTGEGPTFDAAQFEPRPRSVLRGPVQPGKNGDTVAMGDEARLHRNSSFWHISIGALFAALMPVALGSGMTGSLLGVALLAGGAAWQFYYGWDEFKKMSEALCGQVYWTGVYEGRQALKTEFGE